jgi:hypothetical protein
MVGAHSGVARSADDVDGPCFRASAGTCTAAIRRAPGGLCGFRGTVALKSVSRQSGILLVSEEETHAINLVPHLGCPSTTSSSRGRRHAGK